MVDFAAEDVRFPKKSGVCSFSISDRQHRGGERGVSVHEGARSTPRKKYNPYVSVHGERRIPSECM